MKHLLLILFLVFSLGADCLAQQKQPVDYADPLMGTSESRWMLNPGSTLPFGMVQLCPDNQAQNWKAGYEYTIGSIFGFSHIHAWTMAGLSVMPTEGMLNPHIYPHADVPISTGSTSGHRSRINKSTEKASPGYYAADLVDFDIKTELTSTTRCGFFRFTFPETNEGHMLFNLLFPQEYETELIDAKITKLNNTEIEGYSQQASGGFNDYTVHFVIRFNKPFKAFGGWEEENIQQNISEIGGKGDVGAYVDFKTEQNEQILMQTAISLVSIEQARLNLQKELIKPFGWNFDAVSENARTIWNNLLSKIEVEGGSETDKKKFYTNLYRSYVARAIWSDVNGKYRDPCEEVKTLEDPDSPMYGCDAFWNTFWNLNQLWTLVNPEIASKWVKSLLQMYDDGGWLAKGPAGIEYSSIMVASHAIPLIVSAYQKGIRDFDVEKAWEAILHQQTVPGHDYECGGAVGNMQLEPYMKLGYVPTESVYVSNTLEYAYDDWCVSQFAKALNKSEEYEIFSKRAHYYQNMFDSETKFMRPKHENGRWREEFDPLSSPRNEFVEGNSWQYTFFVPHDVKGLVKLIGKENFNNRLNQGFENSEKADFNATGDRFGAHYINHGNQPNMQAAYLFNYTGKPWLTQKWARAIMESYYGSTTLHGWLGDEDEGQMGAWFVMSAMGLFQTNGGASVKPFYETGSPLFEKVTIHLDPQYYPGKTFVVKAKHASPQNKYIQSATLNGEKLSKPWFFHDELVNGGELVFIMGDKPNKEWGSGSDDAPPSMSDLNTSNK
ncbi:alpha-1,2-mannosidase, putative [Tangfeifania diversioriginum]|uniref:Alpha-1,2-mannosidase, putative n=1 Tax=Tangfeifania diversioriginum TaxID=1168035 RepID=A0A1M6E323_9BACT|nr:GH92 family glycosyl hydrolase [Tangfeifania diversioriginum]SHI79841.1 alpha-1,2-mannosidase, putative [Tangfeifania diversioriginum]